MRPEALRVIYDSQPYLVTVSDEGLLEHAYGPFTPGTEPNLAECSPDSEVRSASLRAALQSLIPLSPTLPSNEDSLAGG
jgi:hypothetical protein